MLAESGDDREGHHPESWFTGKVATATASDSSRGPREYRDDPERTAEALRNLVAAGLPGPRRSWIQGRMPRTAPGRLTDGGRSGGYLHS